VGPKTFFLADSGLNFTTLSSRFIGKRKYFVGFLGGGDFNAVWIVKNGGKIDNR